MGNALGVGSAVDAGASNRGCHRLGGGSWRGGLIGQTARWRLVLRAATLAVVVLLVVCGVLVGPQGAAAADYNTCQHTTASVNFILDDVHPIAWTSSHKTEVMTGFARWTWDVEKYNGSSPFSVSEGGAGSVLRAKWAPMVGSVAGTDCSGGLMTFNSDEMAWFDLVPGRLSYVAAHELGHFLGMGHSHYPDSRNGDNPPVMFSCGAGATSYALTQDDHAAVQLLTDLTAGRGYHSATANSSFEEDTPVSGYGYREFWGISSGTTTQAHYSGGVDGTPTYMSFRNYTADAYILSTTALIDNPPIDSLKARANYRRMSSSDHGRVVVKLTVSPYTVSGSGCGNPSRRTGSQTTLVSTVLYTLPCDVSSTAWHYCTVSMPGDPTSVAETYGGVQARVTVTDQMWTAYGLRAEVGVDRVRVLVHYGS